MKPSNSSSDETSHIFFTAWPNGLVYHHWELVLSTICDKEMGLQDFSLQVSCNSYDFASPDLVGGLYGLWFTTPTSCSWLLGKARDQDYCAFVAFLLVCVWLRYGESRLNCFNSLTRHSASWKNAKSPILSCSFTASCDSYVFGEEWTEDASFLDLVPVSLRLAIARELPFLDLRSLAFSDEDFLALTAAFPHTGVTTCRVSETGKGCGGWRKKDMFRAVFWDFCSFNYQFIQMISNDLYRLFAQCMPILAALKGTCANAP